MKVLKRSNLPNTITYNGNVYHRTGAALSEKTTACQNWATALGYKLVEVQVLATKLKGKKDLHDKEYQPTRHWFSYPKMSETNRERIMQGVAEGKEPPVNVRDTRPAASKELARIKKHGYGV